MGINMSYCRFQNTLAALEECARALERNTEDCGDPLEPLSMDETRAARKLLDLCRTLSEDYD